MPGPSVCRMLSSDPATEVPTLTSDVNLLPLLYSSNLGTVVADADLGARLLLPVLLVLRIYPLYLDPYGWLLLVELSKTVRKSGLRHGKHAAMMAVQISTVVLGKTVRRWPAPGEGSAEEGQDVPDGEIRTVPQKVAVLSIIGNEGNLDNGRNGSAEGSSEQPEHTRRTVRGGRWEAPTRHRGREWPPAQT